MILFILLCEVIVKFRSVDENPVCNYSNERFWALFSRGTVPKSRPSISKTNVLYILAVNVNVAFAVRLPVVLNHYFFPSQVWKFWYSRREDLKITFASKLTETYFYAWKSVSAHVALTYRDPQTWCSYYIYLANPLRAKIQHYVQIATKYTIRLFLSYSGSPDQIRDFNINNPDWWLLVMLLEAKS